MKRTIEISTRGTRLSLLNSRVQITQKEETLASIPVEDLGMIILDTTGVSVSSGVLKAIGSAGGTILACDDSHHPCGLFLPLSANTLHSERARLQAEASIPLKKNLWAKLVKAKIMNQSRVLVNAESRNALTVLAGKVRSGDEGGRESRAARIYWGSVFSEIPGIITSPFHRFREGPPPNNLLNYGYTVLRAATARALCIAGLNPALGLHHRNRYSGFCLADDMMEPFRPFIDRTVLALVVTGSLVISKESKATIIGTLSQEVSLKGESMPLGIALERSASSLAKTMEQQVKGQESAAKASSLLLLPRENKSCH